MRTTEFAEMAELAYFRTQYEMIELL